MPLVAVLALVTSVVDGAVVFRVAVLGVLVAAGCGAHRLGRDLPTGSRLLMAVAAMWNPYVLERLAMGQWALLAGYAALWWLVPALGRFLRGDRWAVLSVLAWGTVASLTPTGGLLALGLASAAAVVALVRGTAPPARAAAAVAVAAVWQAPWVLPALSGAAAATSDTTGVLAFASRGERPGGVLLSLVGTGGIWNPFVVPDTSQSWWGVGLSVAAVAALVVGGPRLLRRETGLVVAAAVGLVLALLPHLPLGADLLEAAVVHVPGAGLLRDSQKWLAPYAVALVYAAGLACSGLFVAAGRRGVELATLAVATGALVPVLMVPDGAGVVWTALRPVSYPSDLREAVAVLSAAPATSGEAITLPWMSYRRYPWGNDLSAADPAARWAQHSVVVSDDLAVPGAVVEGEDVRAAQIDQALAADPGRRAAALAAAGVGWVLVYDDAGPATPVDGLDERVAGQHVSLYAVPGVSAPPDAGGWGRAGALMAGVDLLWLAVGLVAAAAAAFRAARAARRRGGAEQPGPGDAWC